MEPKFGHDFSRVRIHTDAEAERSAAEANALAFTVGNHVAFGRSQYQPATRLGRRLLAHELTHVVQQSPRARAGFVTAGDTGRAHARDSNAKNAEHTHLLSPPSQVVPVIQRTPAPMIMRAPIFDSTIEICHRVLKSRKFEVTEGGVIVNANASWEASSDWSGAQPPNCGDRPYNMTLRQSGRVFGSDFGTCSFPTDQPGTRSWGDLPEGEYSLTIWTNGTNPNCCLRGDISVSQQSGISGNTCTEVPRDMVEIYKGVGHGAWSLLVDLAGGIERTAEGLGIRGLDRVEEIGGENERAYAMLKDLFKYGVGVGGPLAILTALIVEHHADAIVEEEFTDELKEGLTRFLVSQGINAGAKKIGRTLIAQRLLTALLKRVAAKVAATQLYSRVAQRIGVSAGAKSTGIGIPIGLLLMGGLLQRASRSSRQLRSDNPELFRALKSRDLDMGYFLVEPVIPEIKPMIREHMLELARQHREQPQPAAVGDR